MDRKKVDEREIKTVSNGKEKSCTERGVKATMRGWEMTKDKKGDKSSREGQRNTYFLYYHSQE